MENVELVTWPSSDQEEKAKLGILAMSESLCTNGLTGTLCDMIYRVNQVENNLKAQNAISIKVLRERRYYPLVGTQVYLHDVQGDVGEIELIR